MFLAPNHWMLEPSTDGAVAIMFAIAAGELDESGLAAGLRDLASEVGERGVRLAAGERQLIAIARAWIAEPVLLILDEATSSLDTTIEAQVHQALRRLRRGRTTLLIAHRLSTVIDADQIAIIESGQVVESGSPAELLMPGGRFATLHDQWLAAASP